MARAPQNGSSLDELSLRELMELQDRVKVAIIERQHTERAEVKSRMLALAAEAGMSIEEILGNRRGRGAAAKGQAAPKYRNPENPDETWSGRGRKPNWLVEKLKKRGVSIEDFAI